MVRKKKSYNKMGEELGVSSNAIYLTLKNKKGVSKALRERILNYALESGYTPDDLPTGKETLYVHAPKGDKRIAVVSFILEKLNLRSFIFELVASEALCALVIADAPVVSDGDILSLPSDRKLIIELFSDLSLRDAVVFEFMGRSSLENLESNITEEHIRDIDRLILWRKENPTATARRVLFRDHLAIRNNSTFIEAKTHEEILQTKGNVLQIAQQLDISPYSVNRVLNGEDTSPSEARTRILHKTNELGYERIYENKEIKLLYVNDIFKAEVNTYRNFFEYLQRAVGNAGNDIIIAEYISKDVDEILRSIKSFQPDGLITLMSYPRSIELLIAELNIPLVSVGLATDLPVDMVRTDNTYSFRQIFSHFQSLGVKSLGYLSISGEDSDANDFRLRQCRKFCEEGGIAFRDDWVVRLYDNDGSAADRLAAEGRAALETQLRRAEMPDAFFSFNDYSTLIFSHVLSQLNREVILTSWDNDELLKPFTFRRFPSIESDKASQAAEAVQVLVERIKHPSRPEKTISIRTRLITP